MLAGPLYGGFPLLADEKKISAFLIFRDIDFRFLHNFSVCLALFPLSFRF
jgi:hypothetical protein